MKFINVVLSCRGERVAQVRSSLGSTKGLQLQPHRIRWWVKIVLTVRTAKGHKPHALWYLLSQQVTDEGACFADFLGSQLRIVGRINDDAEQSLPVLPTQNRNRLLQTEEEPLDVIGRKRLG